MCQHRERWVERLDGYVHVTRRDKKCPIPECPGALRIFHTGSTSNSVAQNLGGDYLAAFALVESSRGTLGDALVPPDALRFREERRRIASAEAPITRRRCLVREFHQHVARLAPVGVSAAPG